MQAAEAAPLSVNLTRKCVELPIKFVKPELMFAELIPLSVEPAPILAELHLSSAEPPPLFAELPHSHVCFILVYRDEYLKAIVIHSTLNNTLYQHPTKLFNSLTI